MVLITRLLHKFGVVQLMGGSPGAQGLCKHRTVARRRSDGRLQEHHAHNFKPTD